jgi:hypothetical protein
LSADRYDDTKDIVLMNIPIEQTGLQHYVVHG